MADEPYQAEYNAAKAAGLDCSLFDFDALEFGAFKPRPKIMGGESVLYRGWMLNLKNYEKLATSIADEGGKPLTSTENYSRCHHLPGWYEQCRSFTPETVFFPHDDELEKRIEQLGWKSYFIKDYVKSNSTEFGSIAQNANEALKIVRLIEKYRGEIEGGVAVRRVEKYVPKTERRYFVVKGVAYAPEGELPDIVRKIAKTIDAPFYSVDVILREDGEYRVVEIGDGQVSDRKAWPLPKFIDVLAAN